MIKLSVIIPGYNTRREWWVRCVRSVSAAVVNACGDAGEILCIDDGSREPVVPEWFNGIPGVRVIRLEKNVGLPTARNAGLDAAQGEFVSFIDSDDEVLEDVYVRTLEALDRTGADVGVFGLNTRTLGDGYQISDLPPDRNWGVLSPENVRELYRRRLFYYSCNKVFRRSFIEAHGMRFDRDGVPCEDAIFNVGLVMAKARWVTVPYIGYIYYRYDNTICSNYKPTYVAGTRACTRRWREYKATVPNAYEIFGTYDETSEEDIVRGEWNNIWRRNSPKSLGDRWCYAVAHRDVLGSPAWWTFLKTAVFMFARVHFYWRPIRVWHQKRVMIRRGAVVEDL